MKKRFETNQLASQSLTYCFQLLPSSFDFCPTTLRPIRWLTASGLHVQNSNMQRLLLLLFFFFKQLTVMLGRDGNKLKKIN